MKVVGVLSFFIGMLGVGSAAIAAGGTDSFLGYVVSFVLFFVVAAAHHWVLDKKV